MVDEGTPMDITVEARGNPMPFLHWYLNGQLLQTGPQFKVTQRGPYIEDIDAIQPEPLKMLGELEAFATFPKDSGVLKCVADNAFGRAETSLRLEVVPRCKLS